MPDQTVTLEANEWQSLIAILAQAQGPGVNWMAVNPLLQKLTAQLQPQQVPQPATTPILQPGDGLDLDPPEVPLQHRRVPRQAS